MIRKLPSGRYRLYSRKKLQAGLRAAAGSGSITKVESLTKLGQLVAYEAHVTTDGKRSEIQVGPDGKPLAHEQ